MTASAQAQSRPSWLLGAIFFLSGAVALIYEAAWQRQFTLLFGSAAPATAVVLAAYFAGLGLGSFVMGKFGARWRQPLRVYAVLEWITAAGALLVAPVLTLYAVFYPALYPAFFDTFGPGSATFLALKGLFAFLAIAVPAMAMGGTLPVLARLFENRRTHFGELAGWLYMLNTAGAATGVLLFPFLLGTMGMKQTNWLCAGLNLLIGAGAFRLAKRTASPPSPAAIIEEVTPQGRLRLWTGLAFASGFVTFVLQVCWTRAFGLIRENSVYSFSFIVALFIAAIAAGAQLARMMLRRNWRPRKALAGAWIAGGILTLAGPFLFIALTGGLKFAPEGEGAAAFTGTAIMVIFVPVALLASALPLILQEAASATGRRTDDLTGVILAANIAGSVAGALAAGFVLPSITGTWNTIILTGSLVAALAGVLAAKSLSLRIVLPCGFALAAWVASRADLPRIRLDQKAGEKLLALREGTHGVVAVVERPGSRRLKLNNHYILGGTASVGDERMQAHIPLLLHPDPQLKLFLGYGTGITAGATAARGLPTVSSGGGWPIKSSGVTALELVPEVAGMAAEFFGVENKYFGTEPGEKLVIEDARNFLRGTKRNFDVIVGDLVVPWRPGEGALYTLEHFEAARARLLDGGLYCAWLPMFQLGREDFGSILSTFLRVFPTAYVWRGDFSPHEPALALVGFAKAELNPETPQNRLRFWPPDPSNPQLSIQPDPSKLPLTWPRAFWMHFVGIATTDPSPLNTEDLPRVELRLKRPPPFVGRDLQAWENELRARTDPAFRHSLPPDARVGGEAGALMKEFTLLLVEGRNGEANAVLTQLRTALGEEVARAVLGN